MNVNQAIAEMLSLAGSIEPASQAAGTYATGPIDTMIHRRLLFVVSAGVVAGGASLAFSLTSGATAGGVFAPVVGLAAPAPPITVAGNKVLFEVRVEALLNAGAGRYVKGQVVVAGGTAAFAVECYGAIDRYMPASDYNMGAVQAVVLN